MARTRRIKRITAGRYVAVVAYDQILASDSPRARQAKQRHSSLARQALNYKAAWKKLQLLLLSNFSPGDFWVCLTYDDEHLPPKQEAAQAEVKKYLDRLRRQARKTGTEIRYIYNTETLNHDGTRRLHHHMVIYAPGLAEDTLAGLWTLGLVDVKHLSDEPLCSDDFIELAQYLTKERFPDAPDRKPGKRGYVASLNLKRPVEESFLVDDTITITAPPGAKIVDQDHKDNEYGRFDYLLYILPEHAAPAIKPKTKPKLRK